MSLSVFDKKIFNGEVFQGYVERIPNPKRNELIKSRAIRPRPELAATLGDHDGGNYMTSAMNGLLSGSTVVNYDGQTDIESNSTDTYKHSRVVVGRGGAWTERDFTRDVSGKDFIENIAEQISDFKEELDQATIIHILNGVFNMSDTEGAKFVMAHTTDVTANPATSEVKAGCIGGATLNSAIQKACGDNKGKFSLTIMHSTPATNLENLKLLSYMKYTDAQGIERDLALATLNGKTVLVDDGMPTFTQYLTAGVYYVTPGGTFAEGDKIVVAGVEVTVGSTVTAAAIVEQLETALATNTKYTAVAGTGTEAGKLVLTEKAGYYGVGAPAVSKTSTAGTVAATTKTAATSATAYVTYILGEGAIEYTDCGVTVPYETERNATKNGGQDTLIMRQRKCFAPYGISFTMASMARLSPTDAELENGANWEIVSTHGSDGKKYLAHKMIPIARIISLG